MGNARFKMIDEDFVCEICNEEVKALGYTARDHCPKCLYSKHVDNNPGDRSNQCYGILKPIAIEKAKKEEYKIVYKCDKCGILKRNKTAIDDNFDLILQIMSNPVDLEEYK